MRRQQICCLTAAALMILLLTGCMPQAGRMEAALSEEERSVLTELYDYDKAGIARGELSESEKDSLEVYRIFLEYMNRNHSGTDWHLVWISTRSDVSPTGEPYDTVIFWTDSPEQSETVKIDRDGPEIIWDSLSDVQIPAGAGSQ